jgi:hypothetical protein
LFFIPVVARIHRSHMLMDDSEHAGLETSYEFIKYWQANLHCRVDQAKRIHHENALFSDRLAHDFSQS